MKALQTSTGANLYNENLYASVNNNRWVQTTHPKTAGKWYAEIEFIDGRNDFAIGIIDSNAHPSGSVYTYENSYGIYNYGTITPGGGSAGSSFSIGDIVGIFIDLDNYYIQYNINGRLWSLLHIPQSLYGKPISIYMSGTHNHNSEVRINLGREPFNIYENHQNLWDNYFQDNVCPYDRSSALKNWLHIYRYLISFDEGDFSIYNGNLIAMDDITLEDYLEFGVKDPEVFLKPLNDGTKLMEENKLFKIKRLSLPDNATGSLNVSAIPKPQVMIPKDDITLDHVRNINSLFLDANVENNGVLRIATSYDQGDTWIGENNKEVDIHDDSDFKNNGKTIEQFNSTDFNELNENNTIRNAYYLEIEDLEDGVFIDTLSSDMDYKAELVQVNNNDVELRITNSSVRAVYNEPGTYVFNIFEN